MAYAIEVNHQKRTVDVDGDTPVLWVLRDELKLKGTNSAVAPVSAAPAPLLAFFTVCPLSATSEVSIFADTEHYRLSC